MSDEFLDEQIEYLGYNNSTPNWIKSHCDLSGTIRYVQIKSCYVSNITISQREGLWATTPMNTLKLLDLFLQADHLIFIFSVNSSRKFYGYARMESLPQEALSTGHFGPMEQRFLGPCFKVRWLNSQVVPFEKLEDITNELNGNLPVKISRDGQELSTEAGVKMCRVLDEETEDPTANEESYSYETKELSCEAISNSEKPRRILKAKLKKTTTNKKQEW